MGLLFTPSWVRKHLHEYEDIDSIPEKVFDELRERFKKLHSASPEACIVVIAYNEEKNVLRSVSSLAAQNTNIPYEVIVVNNNSKDRTQEIIDKTGVKTVLETRQGPGHARQAGLMIAGGKYHLCADADTIYPPTYVSGMIKFLNKKNTSGVFGTYSFLTPVGKKRFTFAIYEIFRDLAVKLRSLNRPELAVGGACFGFYTEYGKKSGWRTDIKRGEDGAMLRALSIFGKVKFKQSALIRAWTSTRTLQADGNFLQIVFKMIKREFKRIDEYFYRKKGEYSDNDKNKI